MSITLNYYPYRKLQVRFHAWAEKERIKVLDRNSGAYEKFQKLFPAIDGLKVPASLTVYKKFRDHNDFFTLFAGPPSIIKRNKGVYKKTGKRRYVRRDGGENNRDGLAGELSEKISQLVERTQAAEAEVRKYLEQIQGLNSEITALKKQNEGLQIRLDECLRNAIDEVDQAISLNGKNDPLKVTKLKRAYHGREKVVTPGSCREKTGCSRAANKKKIHETGERRRFVPCK